MPRCTIPCARPWGKTASFPGLRLSFCARPARIPKKSRASAMPFWKTASPWSVSCIGWRLRFRKAVLSPNGKHRSNSLPSGLKSKATGGIVSGPFQPGAPVPRFRIIPRPKWIRPSFREKDSIWWIPAASISTEPPTSPERCPWGP